MGRRARRRQRPQGGASPPAPESEYTDGDGNILTLRGSLTVGSRREIGKALAGSPLSQEDAWQRALELLFEKLVVRWTIADVPTSGQRELLARFRVASPEERRWVRETLRSHCAEWFPDVEAP